MVQHHHIIGGSGKRKQCETVYSLIALCWDCHHGDYGLEGNKDRSLDKMLKENLERTYRKMGLTEEQVKYWLGGRYYLWEVNMDIKQTIEILEKLNYFDAISDCYLTRNDFNGAIDGIKIEVIDSSIVNEMLYRLEVGEEG